jgi:hypothetical protein
MDLIPIKQGQQRFERAAGVTLRAKAAKAAKA